MKTLRNHISILLLILSFGALALLSGCASPIPVDLYAPDGSLQIRPTATAKMPTALPDVAEVIETATAEPTATAAPTAVPTVADTATPVATATAEDTATPTATATAEDTATPTATATAEDTATATPTATTESTATATSAPTKEATPTKQATATKRATATAEPTLAAQAAATATPRPKPTSTPKPPTATPTIDPHFEVVMAEADLNKAVQEGIAQNDSINVENVKIDLQPGKIVASGRAKLGFFNVDLQIVATATVSNGAVVPEITEIYVNGATATGFVRQQVINMISPYLSQMTDLGDGVIVEKVVITDKDMTISGTQK